MELKSCKSEGFATFYHQERIDYNDALAWMQRSRDIVKADKNKIEILICSHTPLFTYGSGLQKNKGKALDGLVDIDPEAAKKELPWPVHLIKRGGGLTFHYPGQVIVYPVINLNHPKWGLRKVINWLFESVAETLKKECTLNGLDWERELLGLWHRHQKIASVGVGIDRFVTQHGLALNFLRDPSVFKVLEEARPCGLSSSSYTCVSDHSERCSEKTKEAFIAKLMSNLAAGVKLI